MVLDICKKYVQKNSNIQIHSNGYLYYHKIQKRKEKKNAMKLSPLYTPSMEGYYSPKGTSSKENTQERNTLLQDTNPSSLSVITLTLDRTMVLMGLSCLNLWFIFHKCFQSFVWTNLEPYHNLKSRDSHVQWFHHSLNILFLKKSPNESIFWWSMCVPTTHKIINNSDLPESTGRVSSSVSLSAQEMLL